MIQRLQTLYLLLALAATIVCLCLPIASIEPKGMGVSIEVFNLIVTGSKGAISFSTWPLFTLLLATCPLDIAAIMLYKKRKTQIRLCNWSIILCLAWYAYYAFMILGTFQQLGTWNASFAVCLPLIAVILYALAIRGIRKDEELIRSADRIR